MLTGRTYEQVAADHPGDPDKLGLYMRALDDYLADHGYALARKCQFYARFNDQGSVPRTPWPCEPFGPVHLVEVRVFQDAPVNHYVVMLADGTCLDPLTPEPRRLADYYQVLSVAVVIRRPDF